MVNTISRLLIILAAVLFSESNCSPISDYFYRQESGTKYPGGTFLNDIDDSPYLFGTPLDDSNQMAEELDFMPSSTHREHSSNLYRPHLRLSKTLNPTGNHPLPQRRTHDLSKRSTKIPSLPLASLAALGNMKKFFSDIQKSLDAETVPATPEGGYSFLKKKGKGDFVADRDSESFVFPHHIRRMMFGTQPAQPYSHSSLGR